MTRHILFIVVVLLTTQFCFSQTNSASRIDKEDLRKSIQALTSGSLKNRQTGTFGQREAAKFIAEKFRALGLSPFDSLGYYQKIDLTNTYWGDVYLKAGNHKLENFNNMASMGNAIQNEEVEKQVVFGGNGNDDQLNQIEVEDKMVLLFVKNLRAYYEISKKLRLKKAFGVILANPANEKQFESVKNNFKEYVLHKRLSISRKNSFDTVEYIHQFLIPNSEVKTIMGVSVRELEKYINTNSIKSCAATSIKLKREKIILPVETENVVGILKGKSDQSILLSAHFDTYNHAGQNPGADDNASGVATLFELAEQLSTEGVPTVNIIFLATTGEEDGLLGSSYYANSSDFTIRKIQYNLNVDMIGRVDDKHQSKSNYIYCVGNHKINLLDNAITKADSLYTNCSFDYTYYNSSDNSFQNRGDHANFLKKGVPSIMFFSGVHADYHQPGDTSDKINYKLLEGRAQLIYAVISELLK